MGYSSDSNLGYKNTKNNRKLLDAVTYDDNGTVIPLSKRFNEKKSDGRFSLGEDEEYRPGSKMYHKNDVNLQYGKGPE